MNAFDAHAQKGTTSKKKSSVQVTAEVTSKVKKAVDAYIAVKAQIATLTSEAASLGEEIVSHVQTQQDTLGLKGQYSKSMYVPGEKGQLTYSRSDRFSVPQEEDTLSALKKLLGPKKFDEFFNYVRTISVKDDVLKSQEKLQKLADALEKAGISIPEYLDIIDVLTAVKGLDVKQFELGKAKLAEFRTLVPQNKPSLK